MISVVVIEDYVYLVPFVETETEIFLETIMPGRAPDESITYVIDSRPGRPWPGLAG